METIPTAVSILFGCKFQNLQLLEKLKINQRDSFFSHHKGCSNSMLYANHVNHDVVTGMKFQSSNRRRSDFTDMRNLEVQFVLRS